MRRAVTARMNNGVLVASVFSDCSCERNELEIYGRNGCIRLSCYRFNGLTFSPAGSQPNVARLFTTLTDIPGAALRAWRGGDFRSAYGAEWRHFAESIRGASAVECTAEDGRRAVRVSIAAMTSAVESRPVRVPAAQYESELVS